MKHKLFLDTNIILDLLTQRAPHFAESLQLFLYIQEGRAVAYASTMSFATLFYILRKAHAKSEAIKLLQKLHTLVKGLPTSDHVIERALSSDFKDFEDAVQYYTASEHKVDVIITRNKKDYPRFDLPVLTAAEFLAQHV